MFTRQIFRITMGLVLVTMLAREAGAETKQVTGHFEFFATPPTSCSSPIAICFTTTFIGGIQGTAETSGTGLVPSPTPGVILFTNFTTIHTKKGDLFCGADDGAANVNASSDGEFVVLCVITGGTGRFAGASGYLQRFGTSSGALPNTIGEGDYVGKIVTP